MSFRWDIWKCWVLVGCLVWGWGAGATSAWAQEENSLADAATGSIPPGTPGGPCLADGTCQAGAKCFKQASGDTICLFPGDTGNPATQNCPGRSFLQCDTGGLNCRFLCIEARGFGCEATSQELASSWGFWGVLGCFLILLGLGNGKSVQRKGKCNKVE